MLRWKPHLFLVCLALVTLSSSVSCLARRRVITRDGATPAGKLITTDKETLLDRIEVRYKSIQSFSATVDMVPARGSADQGKITEYKDVRAYILFRTPSNIRLIGLFPVVRNKAFDMASDGTGFRLYLPSKNRFIIGRNDYKAKSKNKLENLRPQHFVQALIVEPVRKGSEIALLENFTDEEHAAYILHVLEKQGDGVVLRRDVWFDRLTLRIVRQKIFDDKGDILTDARYSEWQGFGGVPFPRHIEINRPQDEYAVVITIVKMEVNKPLGDDKFALERPEGAELQVLGPKSEAGFAPVSSLPASREGSTTR